jgi:hypothetical protein
MWRKKNNSILTKMLLIVLLYPQQIRLVPLRVADTQLLLIYFFSFSYYLYEYMYAIILFRVNRAHLIFRHEGDVIHNASGCAGGGNMYCRFAKLGLKRE